jgi:hypothetical protein
VQSKAKLCFLTCAYASTKAVCSPSQTSVFSRMEFNSSRSSPLPTVCDERKKSLATIRAHRTKQYDAIGAQALFGMRGIVAGWQAQRSPSEGSDVCTIDLD